MLVEAFVGWLAQEIGNFGFRAGMRVVGGSADEKALRKSLLRAINSTAEEVSHDVREPLIAALRERLAAPPAVRTLPPGLDFRDGIRQAFDSQLSPLADPEITGTGVSFFDGLGIDGIQLSETFFVAFIDAIKRQAAGSDMSTFALLLEMTEIRSEIRRLEPIPAAALDSLPRDVPDFTDRSEALEFLLERDIRKSTPVFTINGMAGVGKTALAIHAAHQAAPMYPDLRLFLDLHAHSADRAPVTASAALETLLRALGLLPQQIPDELDERAALWRSQLSGKRALVLFDNAANPGQVRPLLPSSADCMVIVTSRRRLIALEGAHRLSLDVLPPDESIELFVRIVGRERGKDHEDELRQITTLSGHLPLAIRVVAARLRRHPTWSVSDLLTELTATRDRLSRDQEGETDVLTAFELSYRGLSSDQRRMFRRLSVHPNQTFGVHAAAALDGTDLATTRRLLNELYDQHLVDEISFGRYVMHDLLHDYARHLIEAEDLAADRSATLDRLLDYYISVCTEADRLINLLGHRAAESVRYHPLTTPSIQSHSDAVEWAELERPNLHVCLQIALETGRQRHAVQIGRAMAYFLRLKGYWNEALEIYRQMVEICETIADHEGVAYMRFLSGDIYRLTRRHDDALSSYEQALEEYSDIDNVQQEARTLHSIGDLERTQGDYATALNRYESALAAYRELGNTHAEARALHSIGDTYRLAGRYQEALREYSSLLVSYRRLNDHVGEARIRYGIADVHRAAGRHSEAIADCREALSAFRNLGDRLGEADTLHCLGGAHLGSGDHDSANSCYQEALQLFHELDDRYGEARTLRGMARLSLAVGSRDQALDRLRMALTLVESEESKEAEDVRAEIISIQRAGEA